MNSMHSVFLLMVTFDRWELLDKVLSRIQGYSWDYSGFVVVDNASTDHTSEVLFKFKKSLGLEIVRLEDNVGHGAGLAQGLRRIQKSGKEPHHVVFLEDDSIPKKGYLEFLLQAAQNRKFSLISSDGFQVRLGKRIKIGSTDGEILEADFGLFDGAIARFEDLMKVGFPVENWFMMFDDFEYCYRIKKAGFKIGVISNPYVEILHEGWGGGNSHSHLWRAYYQSRNFVLFVMKHPTFFNILDAIILQSKRLLGGVLSRNRFKVSQMRFLGIKAGLLSKTGKSLDLKTLKEID